MNTKGKRSGGALFDTRFVSGETVSFLLPFCTSAHCHLDDPGNSTLNLVIIVLLFVGCFRKYLELQL